MSFVQHSTYFSTYFSLKPNPIIQVCDYNFGFYAYPSQEKGFQYFIGCVSLK